MNVENGSLEILRRFAPGTQLRDAVDLIVRQGTGALVMFGSGVSVDDVCSGGFTLREVDFSAPRLAELAKMDGGIVVSADFHAIARANVHFIPDSTIKTAETGTRFRTAERLARQTGCPILAVSEEGRSAAIVFNGTERYELRRPSDLYAQADQMLNSIERMRRRLDEALERLTRLEVDDLVTVRDAAMVIQRAALVRRLYGRMGRAVIELGGEADLIAIQASDLVDGVDETADLVYADYVKRRRSAKLTVLDRLAALETNGLYETSKIAAILRFGDLDQPTSPRGFRALAGVPRFPESVKEALIRRFRYLRRLLVASVDDLDTVEGVGTARAEQLRGYLDRLRQSGSIGG